MTEINVAIAGFGKGGRIYNAPIIASVEGLKITTILTSSNKNIEQAQKLFPEAAVVSQFEEILTNEEIDLVVITTPNHLHKPMAMDALQAGKHVVVEKPFTPGTKEADALIELAERKNLVLSVNHNRRWDSDILTIKKLIEEGRLGEIVEYEAHFDRFRSEVKDSWKEEREVPGSGILYDLGSHLIDQALMLFGKPEEIFADLRIQREDSQVIDNFELLLFYPNLKVTLKAGMFVKEKGPKYSVFGRKGTFLKYGMDPQEELLQQGKFPKDVADWGKEPEEIWGKLNTVEEETVVESERGDYRHFYKNIYNAITHGEALKVTAQQARTVIRVIETALKSQAERRKVPFSD